MGIAPPHELTFLAYQPLDVETITRVAIEAAQKCVLHIFRYF